MQIETVGTNPLQKPISSNFAKVSKFVPLSFKCGTRCGAHGPSTSTSMGVKVELLMNCFLHVPHKEQFI